MKKTYNCNTLCYWKQLMQYVNISEYINSVFCTAVLGMSLTWAVDWLTPQSWFYSTELSLHSRWFVNDWQRILSTFCELRSIPPVSCLPFSVAFEDTMTLWFVTLFFILTLFYKCVCASESLLFGCSCLRSLLEFGNVFLSVILCLLLALALNVSEVSLEMMTVFSLLTHC